MPVVSMEPPAALAAYRRSLRLANGRQLHYYDAGSGPATPLILIHGLGDEADTWRRVLPTLAARRRVIALDLPGFGRSEAPRGAHSLTTMARTVAELALGLGISQATLVGSSFGGMVAQRLALARPQQVNRLVLIGGHLPIAGGKLPERLMLMLIPGAGEYLYQQLRYSQSEAYNTLKPYYYNLDELPASEQEFLRRRVWARVWSDRQQQAFFSALRWLSLDSQLRGNQWRAQLTRCAIPTLLVWGEHDQIADAEGGRFMARWLPDAHFETIADSGHLPQQEQPEEVIRLIDGWA